MNQTIHNTWPRNCSTEGATGVILVGNIVGKRSLWLPMYRWEINFECFIWEMICEGKSYTEFIQNMLRRSVVFVVMVMIF
jgi:hypothetical protein